MSAFCAVVRFDGAPVATEVLGRMAAASAARGPDGVFQEVRGSVGFAHLALHATPEAAREVQPCWSADGQRCVVADVRLDNREELARSLRISTSVGQPSVTDIELLLAAFERWGEECADRLVGDFAFASWDRSREEVVCARDALGVRSLYYRWDGTTLYAASEVGAILASPGTSKELDCLSLALYAACSDSRGEATFFTDVRSLPQGSTLVARRDGPRIRHYWQPDPEARIRYRRPAEYAEHFRAVFERAVRERLRTPGGPVGILLSGGLDSCSVAAVAHQALRASGDAEALRGYTFAYPTLPSCDERGYSSQLAAFLNMPLRFIDAIERCRQHDPVRHVPTVESPVIGCQSFVPMVPAALEDLSTAGGRLLLTGYCGDDLVQGSALVYAQQVREGRPAGVFFGLWRAMRRGMPPQGFLLNWVAGPLVPGVARGIRRAFGKQIDFPVAPPWVAPHRALRARLEAAIQQPVPPPTYPELDRQHLWESLANMAARQPMLSWYETLGASRRIDVRHPFLDRRLAEFVLAIPGDQLYGRGISKRCLRGAMRGLMPETVRQRWSKTDFADFIDLDLRQHARDWVAGLARGSRLAELGVVEEQGFRREVEGYLSDPRAFPFSQGLRRTLMLEWWVRWHGNSASAAHGEGDTIAVDCRHQGSRPVDRFVYPPGAASPMQFVNENNPNSERDRVESADSRSTWQAPEITDLGTIGELTQAGRPGRQEVDTGSNPS